MYYSSEFRLQILDSQTKLKKIYSESISSDKKGLLIYDQIEYIKYSLVYFISAESIEIPTKSEPLIKEELLSDCDDE